MGISRDSFYRHIDADPKPIAKRPTPPLALSQSERQAVIDELHNERFQDTAPLEIYTSFLDEGRYLCSTRTMYRILSAEHNGVKERRRHVQRPRYSKSELWATAPNQVWPWEITKLKGPAKWTYFYLYVILNIFKRLVVGWMTDHQISGFRLESQGRGDQNDVPPAGVNLFPQGKHGVLPLVPIFTNQGI